MTNLKSARSVQTITDVGYHRCSPGLYLQVAKSGTKSWLFRFKSPVTSKQREMGLGSLDITSLSQARNLAIEYRRQLLEGVDPLEEQRRNKQARQLQQARTITFRKAAEQCIASKRPEWKNAKHSQQWTNTLTTYAYPIIGDLPISEIDTDLILKIVEPIWILKAETASRVRQRIETVLDWARARKYVEGENPARLRGHLDKILAKTAKVKRVKHHPAVPYKQINEFVLLLRNKKGSSALALEFMILTAARTSEVIGAQWGEFDISSKIWTVPAERMKASKEHRVPLSNQVITILTSIKSNRHAEDLVFPGWKTGTGLSNGAMRTLMKKIEFGPYTPHGFRSTFRDWAADEAHTFQNETIELALAHTIKNQAEAAYRRGDQLERRRELMEAWSKYTEAQW
jgi:integrase